MKRSNLSSFGVSAVVHAIVLAAMAMFTLAIQSSEQSMLIETVMPEVREHEEFEQELDTQVEAAESFNVVAGSVSTNVGGSESPLSKQTKVDHENIVKDPEIQVNVSVREVAGLDTLGDDLGEAEVTGEIGAVVEGYGAALDRLSKELLRLMRSQKLLVVWLFDESESMKDDQEEIRQRIGRVYEELKLIEKDPNASEGAGTKKLQEILLTAVTSFGSQYHVHTPKPTGSVEDVVNAIDQIPVDETGEEQTCQALITAINQFKGMTGRGDRRLAVVVVSDESGDDGQYVEEALQAAKSARAPIYILGREAVFGSLYAHVRWRQPETGQIFYLPIRRGPETPFAEQLQHDGFRMRRDSHMSGFGPYEQVRLARESGGIFFQLPHEQSDLNDLDDRKFDMLDLKQYLPDLSARVHYAQNRDSSEFRKAVWEVIVLLNPYEKGKDWMNTPDHEWFHVNPQQSTTQVVNRIQQITRMLSAMTAAQQRLDQVRPLRPRESSLRWRANFDLIYAQLFAYRVRLFEYAIALGQFAKTMPERITNPKSNRWSISHGSKQLILPDPQQEKSLNVTADQLKDALAQAETLLVKVQEEHPRTPWARRAEWELRRSFGATFREHQYYPKPQPNRPSPSKPRPKPTPPPKL